MNMLNINLVEKWKSALSKKLGRTEEDIVKFGLNAYDFPRTGVHLEFEDGSFLMFNYTIVLEDSQYPNMIALFSEHNGYHEFNFSEDDILMIK